MDDGQSGSNKGLDNGEKDRVSAVFNPEVAGCSPKVETALSARSVSEELSRLRNLQEDDVTIRKVLGWISTDIRPELKQIEDSGPEVKDLWSKYDQLTLWNGVLYIRWETENA